MAAIARSDSISLRVDPEFQSLIPPLTSEERIQLESNLLRDGCLDALKVWSCEGERIIVDGHNRYELCGENGIDFDVVEMPFESRDAVIDWILFSQLGRRNLTPDAASLLRGQIYNRRKKEHGKRGAEKIGQNVPSSTAAEVAQEHGVSDRTIKRDGKLAEAVAAIEPHYPEIRKRVNKGEIPSKKEVIEAAQEPEKAAEKLSKPHVSHNSGENEWYTPAEYIEPFRGMVGTIDLDPASTPAANAIVKAKKIYTMADDGLVRKWKGNVWLNPPYSKDLVEKFVERLADLCEAGEVESACALVNNGTETKWFQLLLRACAAVCFPCGRIRYWRPDKGTNSPLQGQAIFYFGDDRTGFAKAYGNIGAVVFPA